MELKDNIIREFGYAIAILIAKLEELTDEDKTLEIDEEGLRNEVKLLNTDELMQECSRMGLVTFCKEDGIYKEIELHLKKAYYTKYIGFTDDISGYYIQHPEHYTKKVVVYVKLLKKIGIEKAIIATQVYIRYKQKTSAGIFDIKEVMDLTETDKEEAEKILYEMQKEGIIDYVKKDLTYFIIPDSKFLKILKNIT